MRLLSQFSIVAALVMTPAIASAHFPWLAVDKDSHAIMFFSEGVHERDYHLPESIAKAELILQASDSAEKLAVASVEEDQFIGLRSKEAVKPNGLISTSVVYGDYHGMKLIYYAQHNLGDVKSWTKKVQRNQKLQAILQPAKDGGVSVQILWDGKPVADTDVTLFCEEGHEEGKEKTNTEGFVTFSDGQVEEGLNAIMVGHTIKSGEGEDAKPSEAHYMTATFEK